MSPVIDSAPLGNASRRWPRLKTVTLWPAARARSTQGSEIWPVPPTNRTLSAMMILQCSLNTGAPNLNWQDGSGCFRFGAEDEGRDFVDRHFARPERRLAGGRRVDVEADAIGAAELFGVELATPAAGVAGVGDAIAAIIVAGGEIALRPGVEAQPDGSRRRISHQ